MPSPLVNDFFSLFYDCPEKRSKGFNNFDSPLDCEVRRSNPFQKIKRAIKSSSQLYEYTWTSIMTKKIDKEVSLESLHKCTMFDGRTNVNTKKRNEPYSPFSDVALLLPFQKTTFVIIIHCDVTTVPYKIS